MITRRNKIKSTRVRAKTRIEHYASQQSDNQTQLAQNAKRELRQLSLGDNQEQYFNIENDWKQTKMKNTTLHQFYPRQETREHEKVKLRVPMLKRISVSLERKDLYYIKNPSRKYQFQKKEKKQNKAFSSIELMYNKNNKKERIHTKKGVNKNILYPFNLFRKNEENKSCEKASTRRKTVNDERKKTVDHEQILRDDITTHEINSLSMPQSDEFRKTFSAFRDTNMQQITKLQSGEPQKKINKKRASLICSLIRSELKKNSDKVNIMRRKGNIGASKGYKY